MSLSESPSDQSSGPSSDHPLFRTCVATQIVTAVTPRRWDAENDSAIEETSGRETACGALAAWAGLTKDADAIESMITAQMVATHDLSMHALSQAINRTTETGHYGGYINDACKVARVTLQQIETLARYRTWRMRTAKESLPLGEDG